MLLFLDELKFYAKDLGDYEIGGVSSYVKPGLHPVQPTTITVNWDEMNQFIFGKDDKKSDFQERASEIYGRREKRVSGRDAETKAV